MMVVVMGCIRFRIDFRVLARYLKQTNQDVKLAHQMACPVDKL